MTKSSPPYEGGVAAAAADGVVLYAGTNQLANLITATLQENHPPAKAVPLLRKEGSWVAAASDGVVLLKLYPRINTNNANKNPLIKYFAAD
jgi:hypothetical protein